MAGVCDCAKAVDATVAVGVSEYGLRLKPWGLRGSVHRLGLEPGLGLGRGLGFKPGFGLGPGLVLGVGLY